MKALLLISLLACSLCAHSVRKDTVLINGQKFLFVKSAVDSDNQSGKDTILKVYRVENGKLIYLLKHGIYQKTADCNSVNKFYGSYKIKGKRITFETDYAVERDKNFGFPIRDWQSYVVNEKGKMILVESKTEDENGEITNDMK